MSHNLFNSLQEFQFGAGKSGQYYSLPALEKAGLGKVSRLPISLRVVLESALRNHDGKKITESHLKSLAGWRPNGKRTEEIPLVVARVLLQDMTGVPLVVDFAAMREAAKKQGKDPDIIEPIVPGHLIIDHSVQIDHYGSPDALKKNMEIEFQRNRERYQFLKWSAQAFKTFHIIPPGNGICHQVNLEYVSRVVWQQDSMFYPDSLVGIDSHTTMVNGLGVLGWGVGGIEAEAAMLGQPMYFLEPDVVGAHLTGRLTEGVTATDLVLKIVELLRQKKVVGKFVEFFGEGAASLAVPDRATIGNMSPEYGATCGFFPVDDVSCEFLRMTGRGDIVPAVKAYYEAQGMYGMPRKGQIDYSEVVELDLGSVKPAVSGPRRPHDRLDLPALKGAFNELMAKPSAEGGYGKGNEIGKRVPTGKNGIDIGHGDVLISAITSCTNTSNPGVLLGAGLLAKKAVEKGLKPHPRVKTSLAPGSRAVTEYLKNAGLLPYLEQLGFYLSGYGCTTCIGNSGPLDPRIEEAVSKNDVVAAAVLSGNRNFEARIHQNIKANFLMSPPLVVAFALAGTISIDMSKEPIGAGKDGKPVYLRDIWPSQREIAEVMKYATDPDMYKTVFSAFKEGNPMWDEIPTSVGATYQWDEKSTYVRHPPYFDGFTIQPGKAADVRGARVLGIFGDSITTDHISPAGGIRPTTPAGKYLQERGVAIADFNTYGARRGNHEVMMRGTFANVRIKNLMVPGTEGGITVHQPSGEQMPIYEAAMRYQKEGVPSVVFGGDEYGQGSSRDWAAKGPQLLGVQAVIVRNFERIHRANLVFMGVLPLQFKDGVSVQSLRIDGSETIDILDIENGITPMQDVTMAVHRKSGQTDKVPLRLRIDTPIEVDYYQHGGILPYVLRELLAAC
ncbi:MAG: aconitate hydratase 1 [Betaproteobacteria bacterium RIFCSPLOWO2_12_FULL_62_13]|nr:MAG: aconitate hydratase 1 [Betaproteobacteria bacterium RIFCSPLOWO2_12_FULL_62_13]